MVHVRVEYSRTWKSKPSDARERLKEIYEEVTGIGESIPFIQNYEASVDLDLTFTEVDSLHVEGLVEKINEVKGFSASVYIPKRD